MGEKRKVIFVTDGDATAKRAVEVAARNISGRCISASASGSSNIGAEELKAMIRSTPSSPVVVMFDDQGEDSLGTGERLMAEVAADPDIDVLGVVAVASDTAKVRGVKADVSITKDGQLVSTPVGKEGQPALGDRLKGDTVDIINKLNIPVVVGIGDPGKMNFADDADTGAPITTMALKEVLRRSGE